MDIVPGPHGNENIIRVGITGMKYLEQMYPRITLFIDPLKFGEILSLRGSLPVLLSW